MVKVWVGKFDLLFTHPEVLQINDHNLPKMESEQEKMKIVRQVRILFIIF